MSVRRTFASLAGAIGLVARLIPFTVRRTLIRGLLLIESRIGQPESSLKRLFALADDLDLVVNERATAYGGGVHPKHRLTSYHEFFLERIPPGSRVLDVGCGIGAVARSIAERIPAVSVTGIDTNAASIARARKLADGLKATFIQGDAVTDLPPEHWDVIVLSNILEHIADRLNFLARLIQRHSPERLLIRVPLFERHWHLPLRRELGVSYFSDPTHFIEHRLEEFAAETAAAGLEIVERKTLWGEIWALCRPVAAQAALARNQS